MSRSLVVVLLFVAFFTVCTAEFNSSIFCSNSPCQNGGIYTNKSGTCACVCPWTFFNSTNCTSVNPCWRQGLTKCDNGGTLVISSDRSNCSCSCRTGYTGTTCQTRTRCTNTVCSNGGTPYYSNGFCRCLCPSCYSGIYCSLLDPCQATCSLSSIKYGGCNNGVAQISGSTCKCFCYPYWTGTTCTTINTDNSMGWGK